MGIDNVIDSTMDISGQKIAIFIDGPNLKNVRNIRKLYLT